MKLKPKVTNNKMKSVIYYWLAYHKRLLMKTPGGIKKMKANRVRGCYEGVKINLSLPHSLFRRALTLGNNSCVPR